MHLIGDSLRFLAVKCDPCADLSQSLFAENYWTRLKRSTFLTWNESLRCNYCGIRLLLWHQIIERSISNVSYIRHLQVGVREVIVECNVAGLKSTYSKLP